MPDATLDPPLVRTSERTTFARCRQQWEWAYLDRLKPKIERSYLHFGTVVHAALELRYPPGKKRGPSPVETFPELFDAFTAKHDMHLDSDWEDHRELGIGMMEEFIRVVGADERYEVVESEMLYRFDRRGVNHVGTIDGFWRDLETGYYAMKEWKTASQIWARHLPLDEQSSTYWVFGPMELLRRGLIKRADEVDRMIYTFLRKAKPDERPRNAAGQCLNKDGSVSKNQPAKIVERHLAQRDPASRKIAARRIAAGSKELLLAAEGELDIYKAPDRQHCNYCAFRDMCELHEKGLDWQTLRDLTFTEGDPYETYATFREEN